MVTRGAVICRARIYAAVPLINTHAHARFHSPSLTLNHNMSRHRIIAPAEIEHQIDQGEPIVIYEGYALHLGEWINRHPGGRLAILHMVGRDATDEINM